MTIDSFRGQYRFLSNFYPSRVKLVDEWYPTVEHAYQAAKTDDLNERKQILHCSSPYDAKKLGRTVNVRKNWHDISLRIMRDLNWQKYINLELADRLTATYPHELIEGNNWGDTFWGMVDGVGENHLGKILMRIREQILDSVITYKT